MGSALWAVNGHRPLVLASFESGAGSLGERERLLVALAPLGKRVARIRRLYQPGRDG